MSDGSTPTPNEPPQRGRSGEVSGERSGQLTGGDARASELKRSVATAYVREMLDLNPMFQSPQILRRRREIWGTGVPTQPGSVAGAAASTGPHLPDPQADHEFRRRAKICLETLRTKFYQLPDDKLSKYLRIISSERVPEYSATSKRLRAIAPHRQTLLRAVEETGDVKFSYSLQFAMIGTAAQAGALREQYIESLIADQRVAEGCKVVKAYVEQHPQIYQFDHDWFDALLDPSNQRDWSSRYSNVSRVKRMLARPNTNWIVVFLIVSFIVRLVRTADDDSPSRQPARAPSPALQKARDEFAAKLQELQNPRPDRASDITPNVPASTDGLTPEPTNQPEPRKNLRPFPHENGFPDAAPEMFSPNPNRPRYSQTPNRPVVMPEPFQEWFPGVERLLPDPPTPLDPFATPDFSPNSPPNPSGLGPRDPSRNFPGLPNR